MLKLFKSFLQHASLVLDNTVRITAHHIYGTVHIYNLSSCFMQDFFQSAELPVMGYVCIHDGEKTFSNLQIISI
jgi:hypothetical protein